MNTNTRNYIRSKTIDALRIVCVIRISFIG